MKIAILGYGLEGQAARDYWGKDNDIIICDRNPELPLPDGVAGQLGDDYLNGLEHFDLVVRSPQIHPRFLNNVSPDKLTSNVNEFIRVCPSRNIIGVTGTKGKGTTSTLIAEILRAAGKTVHLGGNIGVPALAMLKAAIEPNDYVVLELSNFQLIDLKQSLHIAVCLMVVPEHLDWHIDFEEYTSAKQQLFIHQTSEDIAIYYPDNENSVRIAGASPGHKLPCCQTPGARVMDGVIAIDNTEICHVDELKLLGEHNWQNVCAAVTAVWQITQDVGAIHEVLSTFAGLPHRIELVREHNSVRYYNDSFATGLGATQAAINAVPGLKVVVLGGHDRMLSLDGFSAFAAANTDELRTALLIGASAQRLAKSLDDAGFTNYVIREDITTMSQIVSVATEMAHSGDAVVFSPGFASFDMFKNFEDRGDQFRTAVNDL